MAKAMKELEDLDLIQIERLVNLVSLVKENMMKETTEKDIIMNEDISSQPQEGGAADNMQGVLSL